MTQIALAKPTSNRSAVVGTARALSLGTLAGVVAGAGPEFIAQLFWVAAPVRIATSYLDLPAKVPALRNAKGVLTMGAVAALNSPASVILDMTGLYTGGGSPLSINQAPVLYRDLQRVRQQLWWWATAVAGLTFVATANIRRTLAVMLAGSPSALMTALAIATWREGRHWGERGLVLGHPFLLMAAADVNLVLFDIDGEPTVETLAELGRLIPRLHAKSYRVGLLTATAPDSLRALAHELDVDLWYVGSTEERTRWVAEWQRQGGQAAVVGFAPESLPVMAQAKLAISLQPGAPNVAVAQAVTPATAEVLPDFLAGSRKSARTARHVITASRTLAVAATVATAAGVLAATNILTVANIVGLGLITVNQVMRRSRPRR